MVLSISQCFLHTIIATVIFTVLVISVFLMFLVFVVITVLLVRNISVTSDLLFQLKVYLMCKSVSLSTVVLNSGD